MSIFPNGIITGMEDFLASTTDGVIKNAERWLDNPIFQSLMYYCPKGSGKSTFIRYFLSKEKRSQLARERKLLIKDCPLSTSFLGRNTGVFCCMIDAMIDSVSVLSREEQDLFHNKFCTEKQNFEEYRQDKDDALDLSKRIARIIKDAGYSVAFVIEDFHLLTNSTTCDTNTFNNMALLVQEGLISYIVLSDYHVSVGSAAYRLSEFERIFGGNYYSIPRITNDMHKKLLFEKLIEAVKRQQEIDELKPEEVFNISEGEFNLLMNLTDGIPGMVQNAVDSYYSARVNNNGKPLSSDEFFNVAFEGCKPLMNEWVRYLKDDAYWETLGIIYDDRNSNSTTALGRTKDKSNVLTTMGLVTVDTPNRKYIFTCPLFEKFIAEEQKRPFHVPSDTEKLLDTFKNTGAQFNIGNVTIDKSTNNSKNTSLIVNNAVFAPGLKASDFLQMLNPEGNLGIAGDAREGFAHLLAEQFGKIQRKPLLTSSGIIDTDTEEYQIQQDEIFNEFSNQVIQDVGIDKNHDLIEVSPSELETLDKRFFEARGRNVRPELTDTMLNLFSERCRFYLKLAVVVEDALSFINMDDYSPQLVLYGKALEQALRDNFFDLFHSDDTLSAHPDKSGDLFVNVVKERSYISSYEFIIRDNASYLSQLARNNDVKGPDGNLTFQWWRGLDSAIRNARLIRNKADHADKESPTIEAVNDIFDYLVGTQDDNGILLKSNVGRYLWNKINIGDGSVTNLLNSDFCDATITQLKPDGRIHATAEDTPIAIKISKKNVHQFLTANPDIQFKVDMHINVRLIEYTNDYSGDYFIAKILSV